MVLVELADEVLSGIMFSSQNFAKNFGVTTHAKSVLQKCIKLLMASDQLTKRNMSEMLHCATGVSVNTDAFRVKMLEVQEQVGDVLQEVEEEEDALPKDDGGDAMAAEEKGNKECESELGMAKVDSKSYAEHVLAEFRAVAPLFQDEVQDALKIQKEHVASMLEHVRSSENLFKSNAPLLELEAYIRNPGVNSRQEQIERNALRDKLIRIIADDAVPQLEDLMAAVSVPAELLEDPQSCGPTIMQDVDSSLDACQQVFERMGSLHAGMMENIEGHDQHIKRAISETLAPHVSEAAGITNAMQAFLQHVEVEAKKETNAQTSLLQQQEAKFSGQCKIYLEANSSPSKDRGYQEALAGIESVKLQKQELSLRTKELKGLLGKVATMKVQLARFEKIPEAPPQKKARFSFWKS